VEKNNPDIEIEEIPKGYKHNLCVYMRYIQMTISDSDYIDEMSDTSEDTFSTELEEDVYIIDIMTEDDWIDLYETIDNLIVDIIKDNIIRISNSNVYKEIADGVMEILYETFPHVFEEVEDESLITELYYLVEQIVDVEFEQMNIPKRSLTMTIDTLDVMTTTMVESLTKQINILRDIPQPQQKTKAWYEFRYNLLSASNLWKVFGTDAQRNSLIYEKCKPLDTVMLEHMNSSTGGAMHWGVKYEPVTVMVYEDMYQTRVEEFGCIQHPDYDFIGASPDGINVDPTNARYGRMLEIKNIVNRDITGVPKKEYWTQTQMQMETCKLDMCDFVETRFKEYETSELFYQDAEREYKGVILHFVEQLQIDEDTKEIPLYKPSVPRYVYKPLALENTKEEIEAWIEQQKNEQSAENWVVFNTIYWYLDEFSCVLIQRNQQWFAGAIKEIENLWNIILKERVEGYEHRAAKKRKPKMSINMNDVSNSYITNITQKSAVCLIRLDENGNVI
jgi:putative phage-type endonuclease